MQFSTVLAKMPLLTTNCKLREGKVHTTMEILALFTHPHVGPNLYAFYFFIYGTEKYIYILFQFPVTSTGIFFLFVLFI